MIAPTDLRIPGPIPEPMNQPFWEGIEKDELKVQLCVACGKHVFYPRPICPHCWADALDWVTVSGVATLRSLSDNRKSGHPGWIPVAPYIVGLVELAEGPTLLSHIRVADNNVQIGDRLIFAPARIGGRVLPCFEKDAI